VLSSTNNARVIESEDSQKVLLGFHKPLCTSVDHLHLHAFELPFKSCITAWYKFHNPMFFETVESVISRL
jgi:hypothetical protein